MNVAGLQGALRSPGALAGRGLRSPHFALGASSGSGRQPCSTSLTRKGHRKRVGAATELAASVTQSDGGAQEAGVLEVTNLEAEIDGKRILNGLNLRVNKGEVHAIMGQNGCGKSTFSKVLVGHPDYSVVGGSVGYKGSDLFALEPEERAHAGLFLSFQYPVEIPGVNNTDFLRLACNSRRKALGQPEFDPLEFYGHVAPILEELKIDSKFLNRNVNEGFSGGERKRNEVLQLAVLESDLAILDEIDSGLDIDALREVAEAVNKLKEKRKDMAVVLITHYQRLLDYLEVDYVHIMKKGKVVKTGGPELARELETDGYASIDLEFE